MINVPDECKEYLAIYTTEYADSFIIDPIVAEDIYEFKKLMIGQQERIVENGFDYETDDSSVELIETTRTLKIRKLNKKISNNLKLLYNYRCQICGKAIGEEYGAHICEAHHIDYFVNSLNNNAANQLIVCPNHHSIIHEVNPYFDRKKLMYIYKNGREEKLVLNFHL
jgi:predicted HNH restriction endonuclease